MGTLADVTTTWEPGPGLDPHARYTFSGKTTPVTIPAPFKVPYALDARGRLVGASDASKGQPYECPQCRSGVTLKRGAQVRSHFAHKPSGSCGGESATHHTAKLLVAQFVADDAGPLVTARCCPRAQPTTTPLPPGLTPRVEHRLVCGRVADVALFDARGEIVLVVEVHHTHVVTALKARDFSVAGVRWIEVSAAALLASPLQWVAEAHGRVAAECSACHAAWTIRREVDARTAAARATLVLRHELAVLDRNCWMGLGGRGPLGAPCMAGMVLA